MAHIRIQRPELIQFCTQVFRRLGLSDCEASDAAEILTAADARGIPSHGVARLERYITGVREGIMVPNTAERVVFETPSSIVVDGQGGVGLHISRRTMDKTIAKAQQSGAAFAAVRDSNHFGIAGYYAMMALPYDMIGVAMTNTAALGVPTFAKNAYFGTNPIAVAVPAAKEVPFVLDMSTTVVTRGKIETHHRERTQIPSEWAVDTDGRPTQDAERLLQAMTEQLGGGLLPLGGSGERTSGYKGYGLAVLVDILTGVLSGGPFGQAVVDHEKTSGRVCHFFAAIQLERFGSAETIKRDMDSMLHSLRTAPPAEGQSQVLYAGLKEHLHETESQALGVALTAAVWKSLQAIAKDYGLAILVK